MKKLPLLAASLLLASPAAFGQVPQGTYFGASIGQSHTSFDSADFAAAAGRTAADDRNDTAFKLFAGYRFSPMWAMEAGYTDFGNASRAFSGAGTARSSVANTAWWVAGKGTMAITPSIGLFGKLGLSHNRSELSYTTSFAGDVPGNARDTRSGLLFGVGAEWAWQRNIGVRLEYEDYGKFGEQRGACVGVCQTGRTRVNMFSLGLTYAF